MFAEERGVDPGQSPIAVLMVVWTPCLEAGQQAFPTGTLHLEEKTMTTYVTLINFTEQGLKTIKDTVKRSEAAKRLRRQMG